MSVQLAGMEIGAGSPVVILHGLFGSGTNWRSIAQRLAARHRVLLLDLRNHGASPWAHEMTYPAMAADVRAAIARRGLGPPVSLIGHSMGGKVAMTLALTWPEAVERLVVVDVAPVPNPPTLLAYVRAMRRVAPALLRRRGDADEMLRPDIPDAAIRGFLLQNLVPGEGGGFRWRLDLATIERAMPQITGWPEPENIAPYRGATLFVAGELSDYIRPQDWPHIVRLFPAARLVPIAGAGHWVHAERPDAFLQAVSEFIDDAPGASRP